MTGLGVVWVLPGTGPPRQPAAIGPDQGVPLRDPRWAWAERVRSMVDDRKRARLIVPIGSAILRGFP